MATKTENEKALSAGKAPATGALVQRTDASMQFVEISGENVVIPESLARLLGEGYEAMRHVKMRQGDLIKGIFRGMQDGELTARGEGEIPQVKWVYVEQASGVVVRLLGAYNMITQLARAQDGDAVIIARGIDYDLPNGYRCTDYIVMVKKAPRTLSDGPGTRAAAAVVPTSAA